MNVPAILFTTILCVPPGELVVDHTQPYHWAQPTIRRFERREEDEYRQTNWLRYTGHLDELWKAYRRAGSTRHAWIEYKRNAAIAKRNFIYDDPYYAPVVRDFRFEKRGHGYYWHDARLRLAPVNEE